MGHDISVYIKNKANPNPSENWGSSGEITRFRIGAFATSRQRLFYGTLKGSESANAGVSGNGSSIDFTRQDIVNAINACKYYLDDDNDLKNFVQTNKYEEADKTGEMFKSIFEKVASIKLGEPDDTEIPVEDLREHVADILWFYENILSEYDVALQDDDTSLVQIYFG